MYISLTDQCNMTCEHCCFSATSKKSTQMSSANFMYALQLAIRCGEPITLGGGEPTLHKEFFDFLDKAIEMFDCGSLEFAPFLVTNGKLKRKALKLLDYVVHERSVHVELSQDWFHDPIDPYVVFLFKQHQKEKDRIWYSSRMPESSAGIRTVRRIMPWGRAAEKMVNTEEPSEHNACICDDAFVDPEGRVWSCGCKIHQLGWVWQQDVLDGYDRNFAHQGGFEPNEYDDELEMEELDCADQSPVIDDVTVPLYPVNNQTIETTHTEAH